jgi:hypothetical protein
LAAGLQIHNVRALDCVPPIEPGDHAVRTRLSLVLTAVFVLVASACTLPLKTAGNTSQIALVSSTTTGGWQYDFYRDTAYPCSISGYQTFVVGTKVGSSVTDARPLWVHMHGGGFGWFDANGKPQPGPGNKVEEDFDALRPRVSGPGLVAKVRADVAGFRTLAVSMCSHDVYAGLNTTDPHNPNTTPDGKPRPTTGLISVKAAIEFVQAKYPTTKTFMVGTSAGSAGLFGVAWSMQQQGIAPAGIVADASVINLEARQAANSQGVCADSNDPAAGAALAARVHPDLANIDNEADKLVASGRLTVPIMHVWNHGDSNTCGAIPLTCPMRDGSTVTLGITDCLHEPLRQAIAAQGSTSKSQNLPVCVDNDATPDCSLHVVTTRNALTNTDPASPADYNSAIMNWVHARLSD